MTPTFHGEPSGQQVDLTALSPAQKMDLADILYDIAQEELDASDAALTPPQLEEIQRRIDQLDRGEMKRIPWDDAYPQFIASCK